MKVNDAIFVLNMRIRAAKRAFPGDAVIAALECSLKDALLTKELP